MKFSIRTGWDFAPNALALAVSRRRARGEPVLDWTVSNPTLCGFPYAADGILAALASPASLRYDPDPQGLRGSREVISSWYARRGVALASGSMFLTAGSSEAYSWLFRLLCDAGDDVLIPKPGYPLFDDLARLSDVRLVPYRLRYDGLWHVDLDSIQRGLSRRSRAIVVIHPNNPTGNYLSRAEREWLCRCAAAHDLALIADEVFWTFPFDGEGLPPSMHGCDAPLTFVINGLSKLAGLPQMKLGWVAVSGETRRIEEASRRLAMVGDTYLSVNTPVQAALGEILEQSSNLAEAIRTRAAANYRRIGDRLRGTGLTLLGAEGGWNAILRLPGTRTDEEWALQLVERHGLLAYPGHFFDLEGGVFLVVSLIVEEARTSEYLDTILTIS